MTIVLITLSDGEQFAVGPFTTGTEASNYGFTHCQHKTDVDNWCWLDMVPPSTKLLSPEAEARASAAFAELRKALD